MTARPNIHSAGVSKVERVNWHALPPDAAVARLEGGREGLSVAEATRRLALHGPNSLPAAEATPAWRLVLGQLRSAVAWLLIAAIALSVAAGDMVDAIAIGLVLVLNTAIGVVMEAGAGRALRALRSLETPRAIAVRDGVPREVEARTLVPGDVVLLEEGAVVPADLRLLEAIELRVSEAFLTGESAAVEKDAAAVLAESVPVPDRRTLAHQGSPVLAGRARGMVFATGASTELGRIGALAASVRPMRTALERKLDALGSRLALVALAIAAGVVGLGWWRGMALGELVRLGIALAVATVPEGLPVVATIALAVGVRRMARRRAIVRHLPAVEGLGSTTVVCTDKTGTLTAGEMTVTALWIGEQDVIVTGAGLEPRGELLCAGRPLEAEPRSRVTRLLRSAALASRASVEEVEGRWRAVGDPTDAALVVAAMKAGVDRSLELRESPMVSEVPFSSLRMLSESVHREAGRARRYVKGSPRAVLALCDTWESGDGPRPLDPPARARIEAANADLASRGLRVLAIAAGADDGPLTFGGFAALADPLADGVRETVQTLAAAGVRCLMVTGDQRETALALARDLGLDGEGAAGNSIDARELDAMSAEALRDALPRVAVFSRVSPEQKLRIVAALQEAGELVAMLGDGVNDAAALRLANTGVAMGRRGTEVAREAADIVLVDDRFATIAAALEEGRVIFDNLRKFVYYLVSCNLAEMITIVTLPLLGLPVPFTPLQILWLNLVTDTVPALALAAEPADADVMHRPPRPPAQPLLSGRLLASAGWHAALLAAVAMLAYGVALRREPALASTVAFLTLAMAQVLHLGNARSSRPTARRGVALANRYAVGAVVVCVVLLVAALYAPVVSAALRLSPIGAGWWLLVVALGAIPAVVGQAWRARPRAAGPRA